MGKLLIRRILWAILIVWLIGNYFIAEWFAREYLGDFLR